MSDKADLTNEAQDIAEQIGERILRPYLDLDKIKRAIRPSCGVCKPLRGSDGRTMLSQEFIGNLVAKVIEQYEQSKPSHG